MVIVVKSIIERDDQRLRRRLRFAIQYLQERGKGDRVEVPSHILHLPGEIRYRCADQLDIKWKLIFISNIADTVIGEDRYVGAARGAHTRQPGEYSGRRELTGQPGFLS